MPVLAPPSPELTDGVVTLRMWRDADIDQIFAACQDERIQRFLPLPKPYGRTDAVAYVSRTRRQWSEGSKAAFAITDAEDHETVLGAVNLAIAGMVGNAAYWVLREARGRGVARRALALLTDWALGTLDLGVVLLEIRPENEASRAVALACGYHETGRLDVNTQTGERENLLFSRLAVADSG